MLQISLGNLQIDRRLTRGLILGLDDLAGFFFIAGMETGALAGVGVHAIKHSTPTAPVS